jgi:hypothetical protein
VTVFQFAVEFFSSSPVMFHGLGRYGSSETTFRLLTEADTEPPRPCVETRQVQR